LNPNNIEATETATSAGTGDAGTRGHGPFGEGRGPSAGAGRIPGSQPRGRRRPVRPGAHGGRRV